MSGLKPATELKVTFIFKRTAVRHHMKTAISSQGFTEGITKSALPRRAQGGGKVAEKATAGKVTAMQSARPGLLGRDGAVRCCVLWSLCGGFIHSCRVMQSSTDSRLWSTWAARGLQASHQFCPVLSLAGFYHSGSQTFFLNFVRWPHVLHI